MIQVKGKDGVDVDGPTRSAERASRNHTHVAKFWISGASPQSRDEESTMTSTLLRPLAALLMVLGISLGVAGCGDTWEGLKEDTEENVEDAEDAID